MPSTPLIAGLAGLVILPLVYRIGLATSILVLLLAVPLSAIPELRHIVDSFVGRTPSGRHRLQGHPTPTPPNEADSANRQDASALINRRNKSAASFTSAVDREDLFASDRHQDRFVELDVGIVLDPHISKLLSLIQRDFVDYWYTTSVALSPNTAFPNHTRSLLNVILNNLVRRVRRQDAKEVAIYLFHSVSSALISQLREGKGVEAEDARDPANESQELVKKIRRTSEELMLTLAPRSATQSPMILSLLSEVLSLQVHSTIKSLNADYINTAIVAHLGEAVEAAHKVKAKSAATKSVPVDETLLSIPSQDSIGDHAISPPTPHSPQSKSETLHKIPANMKTPHSSSQAPELPPRPVVVSPSRLDKGKGRAIESEPAKVISLNSKDHTYAASGAHFYFDPPPISTPSRTARGSVSSASPTAATSSSPSTSRSVPSSPRQSLDMSRRSGMSQQADRERFTDRSIEDAIEEGATKLRMFGKNLFNNATKLLDAALPADDQVGVSAADASGLKRRTMHTAQPGSGGVTGISVKGKEREWAPPIETAMAARPASPKPASIMSHASSKPGSSSRPSSIFMSPPGTPASASSALFPQSSHSGPLPIAAPPVPALPLNLKVLRIIENFRPGTPDTQTQLVRQLEHSLFSKDIELLFPAPQDPQLVSVLAKNSARHKNVTHHDYQLADLSDSFHEYVEKIDSGSGEKLLRLWTQLDHFGYMVDVTQPDSVQLQEDAIALLKKVLHAKAEDADLADENEKIKQARYAAYWTACEMVILRLAQNPNADAFEPLQDWILRELQSRYWQAFLRSDEQAGSLASSLHLPNDADPGASSSSEPSASTSKHTLDAYEAAPMAREGLPTRSVSTGDSGGDIGSSMSFHDEPSADIAAAAPTAASMSRSASATSPAKVRQSSLGLDIDLSSNLALHHDPGIVSPTRDVDSVTAVETALSKENSEVVVPAQSDFTSPDGFNSSQSTLTLSSQDDNEDAQSLQNPAFSVTLTDLSPPSAFHNSHVKNKRDLEFLIAVEVEGQPGYILARKYPEFENMDVGIKKALPASGTRDFPRAPLPSTNFQTSENLCRSLEQYLTALLQDDRYAACDPVALFFARERTDSKSTNIQPLAFLGRGVNNIGKGVTGVTRGIGRSGEAATRGIATGLSNFTTAVTTLPKLRRRPSAAEVGSPQTPSKRSSMSSLKDAAAKTPATSSDALPILQSPSIQEESIDLPERLLQEAAAASEGIQPANLISNHSEGASQPATPIMPAHASQPPALPPRPASPNGYHVPDGPLDVPLPPQDTPTSAKREQAAIPQGFHYTPRRKPAGRDNVEKDAVESSVKQSPVLRGRMSFDQLLQVDQEYLRQHAGEEAESVAQKAIDEPLPSMAGATAASERASPAPPPRTPSPAVASALSASEFNNVLSFAMAILEEAYDLVDSTWNIKRGILRVLESILRTSYASVIRAAVTRLVATMSDEQFYAKNVDLLRKSFWPPPDDVWWSSVPGVQAKAERTSEEKEATRTQARKLILSQAPEGLKVSLGSAATAEALGRLHDALQGPGAERVVSSLVLDYLRLLLL